MQLAIYDPAHANQRLAHTVVRLNDVPVILGDIGEDYSASALVLKSGRSVKISNLLETKGLDVSPVPLGFCNLGGHARYLMRRPCRRTQQGLSERSIYCNDGWRIPNLRESSDYRRALGSTISDEYPSLKEATEAMRSGNIRSISIGRSWALTLSNFPDSRLSILYKFQGVVGKLDKDKILLSDGFDFLQETLDHEVIYANG